MTVPADDSIDDLVARLAPLIADAAAMAVQQAAALPRVTVRPGTVTAVNLGQSNATVTLDGETAPVYAQCIVTLPAPGSRVMVMLTPPHGALVIGYVQSQQGFPIGGIIPFAGLATPPGWLRCDGALYLRSEFAALHGVIAEAYGTTLATNFRVPDLRGRVPLGSGGVTAARTAAGEANGAVGGINNAYLPAHTHRTVASGSNIPGPPFTAAYIVQGGVVQELGVVEATGVVVADSNLPPYQTTTYIIRAA